MIAITGNTYPVKEQLKRIGCKWNAADKVWVAANPVMAAEAREIVNGTKQKETVKRQFNQTVSIIDDILEDSFSPEVEKPKKVFTPSKYHLPIFEAIISQTKAIVINATAGSGKTSTIGEIIFNLIPKNKTWIYIVFASRNRKEAIDKFSECTNGEVHTFHSFCLKAIKKVYPKFDIDDEGKKTYQMLGLCSNYEQEKDIWPIVKKIVGLVKNTLTDPNDYEAMIAMCDHYGVELNGSASRILELTRDVVAQCKANKSVIDFDDMPWLVVTENIPLDQYDYVLVDEVQDANKTNIELIKRMTRPGNIVICVGDDNQSCMGFRGAENDAMDQIINGLEAVTSPLPLTYRNPKSHVRFINSELPSIKHEALETAEEGIIGDVLESKLHEMVQPGDMVICRTNAPLVKPAFDLIRRGVKAVIVGRSIGEEIVNLINRIAKKALSNNLDVVLQTLSEYTSNEVARLLRQEKQATAQSLEDKADTIFALADGCKTLAELIGKAETIFSDNVKGVAFSSVHKSKGLEADRVFILKYELMPHKMATKEWMLRQETCIKFVALTRARKELYFVQEESK